LFSRCRQKCRDYQSFRHKKQQTGRRKSRTELLTICVMRRKAGESLATPWNITGCSIYPTPPFPAGFKPFSKRNRGKKQDRDHKSAALEDNHRMLRSALSKTLNPSWFSLPLTKRKTLIRAPVRGSTPMFRWICLFSCFFIGFVLQGGDIVMPPRNNGPKFGIHIPLYLGQFDI
jgi:hypothetical protein